jgi:hypothetical protein
MLRYVYLLKLTRFGFSHFNFLERNCMKESCTPAADLPPPRIQRFVTRGKMANKTLAIDCDTAHQIPHLIKPRSAVNLKHRGGLSRQESLRYLLIPRDIPILESS